MQVSVIIPTSRRCEQLERTLRSLVQHDWPSDEYEITVVENGPRDDTSTLVEAIASRFKRKSIKYIYEPIPGLLAGRHRGAIEAKAEICAFLDDDVRVNAEWLPAIQEAFRDPQVALAGGPSTPIFAITPPSWLSAFYQENEQGRYCTWLSLLDGGTNIKEIDAGYVFGLNFIIRKKALFDCRGFHPDCLPKPLQRFQGDGETGLSMSVRDSGLKALYHPAASVGHEVPRSRLTIRYFRQRAFYQGVCDSYTKIRQEGNAHKTQTSWYHRLVEKFWMGQIKKTNGLPYPNVMRNTDQAYRSGFAFHQNEVHKDARLLDWVLRRTYFDRFLPEGWETLSK